MTPHLSTNDFPSAVTRVRNRCGVHSRWTLLLPFVILASACAQSTPESRGQSTFTAFGCIKCHSIGHGGGVYGPDLTTIGFRKSKEWLDQWLHNPHEWKSTTVMPNFNLNDDIRADLVAYLSQQKGQAWGDPLACPCLEHTTTQAFGEPSKQLSEQLKAQLTGRDN